MISYDREWLVDWDMVLYLRIIVYVMQMPKLNDNITVLDARCFYAGQI